MKKAIKIEPADIVLLRSSLADAEIGATAGGEEDGVYIRSSSRLKWDTATGTDRSGVTNSETALDGKANTDWMLANTDLGTTDGTIWKFCQDVRTATGDDSWYVPSAAELKNRYDRDSEFWPGTCCWSSSEASGNPANYAYLLYYNGDLGSYGTKNGATYVVLFRAS